MTSAPCPAHPKARFEHFCGECGNPTSSYGRELKRKSDEPKQPRVRFHNHVLTEDGDNCTTIQIDNMLIRVRNVDLRRASSLGDRGGAVMIDARSVDPIRPGRLR